MLAILFAIRAIIKEPSDIELVEKSSISNLKNLLMPIFKELPFCYPLRDNSFSLLLDYKSL